MLAAAAFAPLVAAFVVLTAAPAAGAPYYVYGPAPIYVGPGTFYGPVYGYPVTRSGDTEDTPGLKETLEAAEMVEQLKQSAAESMDEYLAAANEQKEEASHSADPTIEAANQQVADIKKKSQAMEDEYRLAAQKQLDDARELIAHTRWTRSLGPAYLGLPPEAEDAMKYMAERTEELQDIAQAAFDDAMAYAERVQEAAMQASRRSAEPGLNQLHELLKLANGADPETIKLPGWNPGLFAGKRSIHLPGWGMMEELIKVAKGLDGGDKLPGWHIRRRRQASDLPGWGKMNDLLSAAGSGNYGALDLPGFDPESFASKRSVDDLPGFGMIGELIKLKEGADPFTVDLPGFDPSLLASKRGGLDDVFNIMAELQKAASGADPHSVNLPGWSVPEEPEAAEEGDADADDDDAPTTRGLFDYIGFEMLSELQKLSAGEEAGNIKLPGFKLPSFDADSLPGWDSDVLSGDK